MWPWFIWLVVTKMCTPQASDWHLRRSAAEAAVYVGVRRGVREEGEPAVLLPRRRHAAHNCHWLSLLDPCGVPSLQRSHGCQFREDINYDMPGFNCIYITTNTFLIIISYIHLSALCAWIKEPVAKEPVYWNVLPCEIPQLDIPNVGRNHIL